MNEHFTDLDVELFSDALVGKQLDVVISGSIGAVESVRFIRALRRLGAKVTPWLTTGGSQFITPMALEWAAAHPCQEKFSGTATHICVSDAVVIAPCSSSFLGRIASGQTETPASSLVASALGQKKTVLILPAMHESLAQAPAYQQNLAKVSTWSGVKILGSRLEEGKRKFPIPAELADIVAHHLRSQERPSKPVLLTMGTTRGYIDDVRYISNYSSGKLGTLIAEEFYRQGFQTAVVAGPSEFKPHVATTLKNVSTTSEMLNACVELSRDGVTTGIFCASVLDYEPTTRQSGKIKSDAKDLQVTFKPTPKIISNVDLKGAPKFAFKLETDLTEDKVKAIAKDYFARYQLRALIANQLKDVSAHQHQATAVIQGGQMQPLATKQEIARWLLTQIKN